jgi:hypothetical protein
MSDNKIKEARLEALEAQVKDLKEAHDRLSRRCHEFVEAAIQAIKEVSEE